MATNPLCEGNPRANIRAMKRSAVVLGLAAAFAACTDHASPDVVDQVRLAGDLVKCQNDQSALKDEVATLRAEVAKLRAAAAPPSGDAAATPVAQAGKRHRGRRRGADRSIPADLVERVVQQGAPQLRVCYEKALKRNPAIQTISSVKTAFNIRETGQVYGAVIAPHVDPTMEKCMLSFIGRWRFPAFKGDPVRIESPVNLVAR
jgi:hypothetical protein